MKRRLVVLVIIALSLSAVLAYVFFYFDFIPRPYSTERQSIDLLVRVLFSIASIFFSFIIVVFIDSIVFSRSRPGDTGDGPPVRGNTHLELTWTLIPFAVVIALGIYGGIVLNNMTELGPPQSELQVNVTCFRWGWLFEYPEYGIKSVELGLPVNHRVMIQLQSLDVIHSFWVAEFGPKQDAVPGMTTELQITPTVIGQYKVQCSQLCGAGHTYMIAPVSVMSAGDFQKWVIEEQATQPKK